MGAGPLQFESDVLTLVRSLPALRSADVSNADYTDVTDAEQEITRPLAVVIGEAGTETPRTVPYRPHQGTWSVAVHLFYPNDDKADWEARYGSLVDAIYEALSRPGVLLARGRPIVRVSLDGQSPIRRRGNGLPARTRRTIRIVAEEW
jgi:hypothetical protein